MKKTLLTLTLFVAALINVNAQQITVTQTAPLTFEGGEFYTINSPNTVTGTLNSISISAILDDSTNNTYASDLTILVTETNDINSTLLLQVGGFSDFNALEGDYWYDGDEDVPGTTLDDIYYLIDPIDFTNNPNYTIWIGNGYIDYDDEDDIVYSTTATWSNIELVFDGISEITASVNDNLASNFSVSPNPATDVVTISSSLNTNLTSVAVIDVNGRTVKAVNLGSVANAQINIADLASGVYMLNIASEEGTVTKKIVKN
jgi:hypothetical protein